MDVRDPEQRFELTRAGHFGWVGKRPSSEPASHDDEGRAQHDPEVVSERGTANVDEIKRQLAWQQVVRVDGVNRLSELSLAVRDVVDAARAGQSGRHGERLPGERAVTGV